MIDLLTVRVPIGSESLLFYESGVRRKYTFGWLGLRCRGLWKDRFRVYGSIIKKTGFSRVPVHDPLNSDGNIGFRMALISLSG